MSVNSNCNNSDNEYYENGNERPIQGLWATEATATQSTSGSVSRSLSMPMQHEEVNLSLPLVHQQEHSTSINMEGTDYSVRFENNEIASPRRTRNVEQLMEQYARALREHVAEVTRTRFNSSTRNNVNGMGQSFTSVTPPQVEQYPQVRSLRSSLRSLNNVLSPEIIRSFSHPATSTRYSRLPNTVVGEANNISTRIMMSNINGGVGTVRSLTPPISADTGSPSTMGHRFNISRSQIANSSLHEAHSESGNSIENSSSNTNPTEESNTNRNQLSNNATIPTSPHMEMHVQNSTSNADATPNNAEFDNNIFSDIFLTLLRHCLHYIPFVCILFVKFIYDHLVGIVDVIVLQGVMYFVSKSLQSQVAKFAQKQNRVLLRDFFVITIVVVSRFLFASARPDPFGLLITPPPEERSITHHLSFNHLNGATTASSANKLNTASTASPQIPLETTVIIPKLISLETIIYYTAVNDLVLKLITISIKILVTLIPVGTLRYKPRARLFVFVEYLSQFYRALAPIRQWMLFLFESYSGLHAISGVLFSSIYIVLKGCEMSERGKSLKKALVNLIRNMDYARKPTMDELDAADSLCPICHDSYNVPVILECGHIFCDGCVTTWFKREQTCPMCRAKVNENPTWQDGSTTFFYQLY